MLGLYQTLKASIRSFHSGYLTRDRARDQATQPAGTAPSGTVRVRALATTRDQSRGGGVFIDASRSLSLRRSGLLVTWPYSSISLLALEPTSAKSRPFREAGSCYVNGKEGAGASAWPSPRVALQRCGYCTLPWYDMYFEVGIRWEYWYSVWVFSWMKYEVQMYITSAL